MKKFIVIDTETVQEHKTAQPIASASLVYDCGFIVADKNGGVYDKYSFANSDFIASKNLMRGAYYYDKLEQYYNSLGGVNSSWYLADTATIIDTLNSVIKKYNIKDIYAYNCRFDRAALNYTVFHQSNNLRRYALPTSCRWFDIWDFASKCITNTKRYVKWCIKHNELTHKGNPKTSAETVYRYLTGDTNFTEQHTALSDSEIELTILLQCFKRKAKKPTTEGNGWRAAATIAKTLTK